MVKNTEDRLLSKTALITGITGQDGAYLAEFLLEKGYEVHGIKRRASTFNTDRIDHLYQDPHERDVHLLLHYGDLTDATNLIRIIQQVQPDEIYNLAAQSHVAVSSRRRSTPPTPTPSARCACSRRSASWGWRRRRASTRPRPPRCSARCRRSRRSETTPFYPRSPYGVAKVYALLDHGQLPRGLRDVRLQRHSLQPRIAGAR